MKKAGIILFIITIVVGAYCAYQISIEQEDNYTTLVEEYQDQRDTFNEYALKADELGMLQNQLFLEKMIQLGNSIGECERRLNVNVKGISSKEYKELSEKVTKNAAGVNEIVETIDGYEKRVNNTN